MVKGLVSYHNPGAMWYLQLLTCSLTDSYHTCYVTPQLYDMLINSANDAMTHRVIVGCRVCSDMASPTGIYGSLTTVQHDFQCIRHSRVIHDFSLSI